MAVMAIVASLDVFERIISDSTATVLELRRHCGELDKNKSSDAAVESKAAQLHHRLNDLYENLTELRKDYASLSIPNIKIPWLEADRKKRDMTYIGGDNPWEFFLSYSNKDKLNKIGEDLKAKHDQNSLRSFAIPPKEGEFVVCHAGKKFFRAQVLKCCPNGRLRVLKIDSNEEGLVQSCNIYQVPQEIADIPCQTVRCCLNVEDQYLKERWCKELELIFKKTLSEGRLTVDMLEKLNGFAPPKFFVRLYVYSDDVQEEINLSSWINGKVLADLKLLSPDDIDDIMAVLDDECMDPFYASQTNNDDNRLFSEVKSHPHPPSKSNLNNDVNSSNGRSTTGVLPDNTSVPNVVEIKPDCQTAEASALIDDSENLDEPDSDLIGLSVEKVSTWMEQYSDEKTIKLNQKVAKYDVPKLEEPSFSFSKHKTSLASDNAVVTMNGNANANLPLPSVSGAQGACSSNKSSTCAKLVSTSSSSKHWDKQSTTSCKMSANAPEFVPSCFVEIIPGTNDGSYENVISNLEDEYQPKDEKRLCRFYQKKGFCSRIACTKEHVKRSNRWTDDVEEIEKGLFNNIDLPLEGCETIIRVQHVENAHTFFSTLHEIYSDINEYGFLETLETLHNDLNSCNSTSPHPLLETMPALAEMVLALGLQRTLGPGRKWLRAIVTETLDQSTVEVFFLDFGNKEIVPTKDLRQIRPQFMHLPSQAVRTSLASLQIVPEQRKAGKTFLEKLIKGKTMKAKVVSRDVFNAEMEVILFTPDDVCVNNLIVDQGFCLP